MVYSFGRFWGVVAAYLGMCSALPLPAAELPFRIYTTQDGLLRDDVNVIRRDSRGYLLFGTPEGLSIFDGYQFANYTANDGLPKRSIEDILETRSGEYWIATYDGLCRFDPKAGANPRFTTYHLTSGRSGLINVLRERRDGSIWFGTEGGLWRMRRSAAGISAERIRMPSPHGDSQRVFALSEDREGNLWVGTSDGLYAIWRNGQASRFVDGRPESWQTMDVLQDRQGRIWTATGMGISRISPHPRNSQDFVERVYKLPSYWPTALFQSSDGQLWASGRGLYEFDPDAPEGREFRQVAEPSYKTWMSSIAEDLDRNLWVAGPGPVKLTRHGLTTYSARDGLEGLVGAITANSSGRICPITLLGHRTTIREFDGHRFTGVIPNLPAGFSNAWGDAQIHFQDHAGDWWVPTANGLLRFAAPRRLADLATARPKAIYSMVEGLPGNVVLCLFEDSKGDVWIGVWEGLARWERSTGRIRAYSSADGLRHAAENPPAFGTPRAIVEDRAGQIWVGFHPSGLARYREGRFDFFTEADGLPTGQIAGLYCDHAGRLWIGSSGGGAARIDDVTAPHPSFRTYTTAQGLSSNQIFTIVEDSAGLIYLGGGRGVDRLAPDSGNVRHFTPADGLPPVRVQYSRRDRDGALWFASDHGLSRYVPEPDRPSRPQPPLIRVLRIEGRPSAVSVFGERAIDGIQLKPAQNSLQIEFASLHFVSGEVLRYQYRLEGADREWSPPTDQRTVNYSSLSPGAYQFEVRAVNGDGLASERNATVSFVISPPFWRQAWSIIFVACGLAAMLYTGHRYRLQQLLHLERIRTRLASDLHDDIGSGLAEIAILTDVAEAQPRPAGEDLIRKAGDRARQLREAMSDIVWSVDPQHGNLTDLIGRVRQTVFSLMESNGTRVTFEGPAEDVSVRLAPDRTRQVLLITKEALTNVLTHADASEVFVRLQVENGGLMVEVQDNGRGFEPTLTHTGMGLRNLRRRAAESGGELTIESSPGHGTRLRLALPLGWREARMSMRVVHRSSDG